MRVCNVCGIEKSINEFPKSQDSKGNTIYRKQCKKCWNKKVKIYSDANRDRIRANAKKTYDKNKESRNARQNIYRDKNKDIINRKARELYATDESVREKQRILRNKYRSKNRDKMLKKQIEWNRKNAKKKALKNIEWVNNNKDKVAGYASNWLKKNPVKRKAQNILNNALKKDPSLKASCCFICGTSARKLQAHHHDYNQPLNVIWCCQRCHYKLDKMRREEEALSNS